MHGACDTTIDQLLGDNLEWMGGPSLGMIHHYHHYFGQSMNIVERYLHGMLLLFHYY